MYDVLEPFKIRKIFVPNVHRNERKLEKKNLVYADERKVLHDE